MIKLCDEVSTKSLEIKNPVAVDFAGAKFCLGNFYRQSMYPMQLKGKALN
jgi:hypothetical protein